MNRCLKYLFIAVCCFLSLDAFAQARVIIKPKKKAKAQHALVADDRRPLTRQELQFYGDKVDSIRNNLDKMVRYEKQLMQRNYYIDEKTALISELIRVVESLDNSTEVIAIDERDIKQIFGKPFFRSATQQVFNVETYKSNCAFVQITVTFKNARATRVAYQVTDCERPEK